MPSSFAAWTLEDLKKAIAQGIDLQAVGVNRRMFEGDMWLDNEGWIGPRPQEDEEGYFSVMEMLEKSFISKNIIAEVCERHMTGVCGTEPAWALVPRRFMPPNEKPDEAEDALIVEAEEALTRWVNKRRAHIMLQNGTMTLLWAGRSSFRLFVPSGFVERPVASDDVVDVETDDEGNPVGDTVVVGDSSLDAALDMIFPQELPPEVSAVITDVTTMEEAGVFLLRNPQTSKWEGELVYLEPETGLTVIRPILDDVIQPGVPVDMGGMLSIFEMRRRLLITPQVVQQQKAYNLAASCIPRTVVTAGFLERVLLNAQMPGEWERDADGNPIRFIPAKYVTGGGSSQFVQGIEVGRDPQTGEVKLTTPQIQWREPGQVLMPVQAKEAHYRDILDEADQSHVFAETASSPSGVSREQARAGYEKSLQLTQPEVQNGVVWLLTGALALAEYLLGQPGRWTGVLRVVCDAHLDTGPVTPDEERVVAESIEAGLMSEETGMARLRIPDVDAEKVRIMRQPGARLGLVKRQAEVLQVLTSAGFDLESAAMLCGFDDEQLAIVTAAAQKKAEEDARKAEETLALQEARGDGNNAPPEETFA